MALARTLGLLGVAGLGAAAWMGGPAPARACGGTFCDGGVPGPQQMPVDQTGENILFVIDENQVEAHIQIQYEGDPARFGWVIPVTAEPQVKAGSQRLFENLLNATVPVFTLTTQQQTCDGGSGASSELACGGRSSDGGDFGGTAFTAGGEGSGDGDGDDGDPQIVDRGFAGAFQYDVLKGGTVEGVVEWLDAAGYVQDPDAAPILEQYLEDDFLFVAIKLRAGVGVDEIHPITITYAGDEPCIPIRLTAIAAVPDLGIRAFFLGEARVVPANYAHVILNLLHIDWLGIGAGDPGYDDLLSQAVDEAEAGQAFVTEYAGTSSVVSQAGLVDARWDASAFPDAEWTQVIGLLTQQGLLDCYSGQCNFVHPLVQGLLEEFFPPPYNVDPESFWSDPSAYAQVFDPTTWDGPEFAAGLEDRIIMPGEHAIDLLAAQPYLTRMFTTISPEEMTEDPLFHENPDLPDVSNRHGATNWLACTIADPRGPDWIELDDGRVIALDGSGVMPGFPDMPFAERIETTPDRGAPQVDVDHIADIAAELEAFNEPFREVERGGCNCSALGLRGQGLLLVGVVLGAGLIVRRRR